MKNDLLSDYFLNEYIPLHPSHTRDDLLKEFMRKAKELGLFDGREELLFEAFTHKSFAHESKLDLTNNERLEFLGDSVLQLIVSENLMQLHPDAKEGELSKLRSSIVNEYSLSELAKRFGLNKLILLGRGELGEKGHDKASLLANCFEAYLGAVYLSNGFEDTKSAALEMFAAVAAGGKDLFHLDAIENFDAKSRLQEALVKLYQEPPKYACEENKEKLFHITITIKGEKLGELTHKSKKKGMQELAKKVLKEFQNNQSQNNSSQENSGEL